MSPLSWWGSSTLTLMYYANIKTRYCVERFIPERILAGCDFASVLFRKKKKCRFDYPQQAQGEIPFRCMCCCYFARSLEQSLETDLHTWTAYFKFLHKFSVHVKILCFYITRHAAISSGWTTLWTSGSTGCTSTANDEFNDEQEEMTRCTEVLWLCAAEVGGCWVKWLSSYYTDKNIWWS